VIVPKVNDPGLPRWAIAVGAVSISLVGWGLWHPDFRPNAGEIDPTVRAELAKTGFKATQGVSSAAFKTTYLQEGEVFDFDAQQKVVAIDALLTEKRSRRFSKALTLEYSGLYAGPITVVRHWRTWPPLIGNLLPYSFWSSSRMTEFRVEQNVDFPHASGGKLVATITYENRHADGAAAPLERMRLRCDVKGVSEAASIDVRLAGAAARIDCIELVQADPGSVGASSDESPLPDYVKYSHLYLLDRGWSIAIEGEEAFRTGAFPQLRRTWQSKLVAFE
jgi:hypothetical protein